MFKIAEKVAVQVGKIQTSQSNALDLLNGFVNNLRNSHLDPRNSSWEIVQKIQRLSATVEDYNQELEPYAALGFDIDQHLDQVDTALENASDQFYEWTNRRILTVQEACEKFHKSRWTIYRWIKQGKLNAFKNDRNHWAVIA